MTSDLRCRDAVVRLCEAFGPDTLTICANGYISREVFVHDDRPHNFYMIGSMGLAGSIALGCALAQPERKILVLDGDGNVLMGMGAMALIGAQAPKNLFHACLDNGVYASTGNQPTVAPNVSLEGVAAATGYTWTCDAKNDAELQAVLPHFVSGEGPSFLRVRITPEPHPRDFARVSHTPAEIRARFEGALRGSQG